MIYKSPVTKCILITIKCIIRSKFYLKVKINIITRMNNAETLNIVSIIENNPINCITNTHNNKLITKINENFTNDEQHMFIASFYSYLNYNKADFVIDLENIYKWLGFERKSNCKNVLVKHFKIDTDYKIENLNDGNETIKVASATVEATPETIKVATVKDNGGSNKEKITMTITTFKKLCLKANTKKANTPKTVHRVSAFKFRIYFN